MMQRRTRRWIGRSLMVSGIIHLISAFAIYWRIFLTIFDSRVFNSIVGNPVIGAFVWSVMFGCVAVIGGMAVDTLEKVSVKIPQILGWSLLALAIMGVVLVPVSGFWLLFPAAITVIARDSRLPRD